MPTRTSVKRKRGKSRADVEEDDMPIDTRLLEEENLRFKQQYEALQTPPPSNEEKKDAAPINGDSEEDIQRVFDFINSIQSQQQRSEGDADSEDSRTEGRADADAERAGIGQSPSNTSELTPPSPPASAASAPTPAASTSAPPRKKAAAASASTKPRKRTTRKSTKEMSQMDQLMMNMQGLYDTSAVALNPGFMAIAQNAMRNLADFREYKETGAAAARLRQVPPTSTDPPSIQQGSAHESGTTDTVSTPAPSTGAAPIISCSQWIYISFDNKKIRVPADSLDKWKVVYPDVVVLDQDAS